MNIAVLNAGSGSQKLALFSLGAVLPEEPPEPAWTASINSTTPDQPEGKLWIEITGPACGRQRETISKDAPFSSKVERLLDLLRDALDGGAPDVIGHRVVHGGGKYHAAVPVSAAVEQDIERFAAFAPLHNHDNLEGIRTARRCLGASVRACAVFDTAFHHTLPPAASTYAGPHEWLAHGLRRHGFHGTSFRWASQRAAALLERRHDPSLRLILCHLGGGCSLAATIGGRCIDTTMGLTPLDGIPMCTRSGAVDPGILIYLLRQGMSVDELETLLNKHSGLKGLSGLAGDTRAIQPRAEAGDPQAQLALEVFIHGLARGIGQMLAALAAPPHALVFTDAIGQSAPFVRTGACHPFRHLGLELDEEKNAAHPLMADADIAVSASRIRALVIRSREDWQIARECFALEQSSGERVS